MNHMNLKQWVFLPFFSISLSLCAKKRKAPQHVNSKQFRIDTTPMATAPFRNQCIDKELGYVCGILPIQENRKKVDRSQKNNTWRRYQDTLGPLGPPFSKQSSLRQVEKLRGPFDSLQKIKLMIFGWNLPGNRFVKIRKNDIIIYKQTLFLSIGIPLLSDNYFSMCIWTWLNVVWLVVIPSNVWSIYLQLDRLGCKWKQRHHKLSVWGYDRYIYISYGVHGS